MSKAIDDIAAERQRQIEVEGFSEEHDDQHGFGELAKAAGCYLLFAEDYSAPRFPPLFWPLGARWWKPKDERRNLVRAGALIAAAIDRLDREARKDPA